MNLLQSGVRLSRLRARRALRRMRRLVRRGFRGATVQVEQVEILAAALPRFGQTRRRLAPTRRFSSMNLVTLRAHLLPAAGGTRIQVRAERRPLARFWSPPSDGADLGLLEQAREEANRLALLEFLAARNRARRGALAAAPETTRARALEEHLLCFPLFPHNPPSRQMESGELRRLLVLPMEGDPAEIEERLPPPFHASPSGQVLLYVYVDGGSAQERIPAGRERLLVFGCAAIAGLAADGVAEAGLFPFWEGAVRLDRPHLPGESLRAAYVFNQTGILFSVGNAKRETLLRLRALPERGLRAGDTLPLPLAERWTGFRFEKDLSGVSATKSQSDFAVNRVYLGGRLACSGPSPEDFVFSRTGIVVRRATRAFFCPRVDVHATPERLRWETVQYRALGSARTTSLLQSGICRAP